MIGVRGPAVEHGSPFPLGATWDGKGVNFALFPAHAEKVELCLFDDARTARTAPARPSVYTDGVWHGYVPTRARACVRLSRLRPVRSLTTRHRFNPHKL
jgi:isoamylase